jgi:hypothetical protein
MSTGLIATESRLCKLCEETKPLTLEFWHHVHSKLANGQKVRYFNRYCRECIKQYRRDIMRKKGYYKPSKADARRKRFQKWISEGNTAPLCACGCGQPVASWKFEIKGPALRLAGHHQNIKRFKSYRHLRKDLIPSSEYKKMLQDFKKKYGFTWDELSSELGISVSTLTHTKESVSTHRFNRIKDILESYDNASDERRVDAVINRDAVVSGRIIGLMIVKNEASRYLHSCLEWHSEFVDDWFIVDDGSIDETYDLCLAYTQHVVKRPTHVPSFSEDESAIRNFAWKEAERVHSLTTNDWLLLVDADEFFMGSKASPKAVLDTYKRKLVEQNLWGAHIHFTEMWEEQVDGKLLYRKDGYWNQNWNTRFIRYNPAYSIPQKKMGCPSVPAWYRGKIEANSEDAIILHMGYLDAGDRLRKYESYISMEDHGHNQGHINSIVQAPSLAVWDGPMPNFWRGIDEDRF